MRGAAHLTQSEFDIRCEWGLHGVESLAPVSDVVVIVDVLSYSTCVDIATANGAAVFPCRFNDESARDFAQARGALLAGRRGSASRYSLSLAGLLGIPPGTRLVLPSPNGSTLSLATGATPTLAGCLRNSRSVASHAGRIGRTVVVIPCGERWDDGSLRPAIEDLVGARAIIRHLHGSKSPEAKAAEAAFESGSSDLLGTVRASVSGQQLAGAGYRADVEHSARLDCSESVPLLRNGVYIDLRDRRRNRQ